MLTTLTTLTKVTKLTMLTVLNPLIVLSLCLSSLRIRMTTLSRYCDDFDAHDDSKEHDDYNDYDATER